MHKRTWTYHLSTKLQNVKVTNRKTDVNQRIGERLSAYVITNISRYQWQNIYHI